MEKNVKFVVLIIKNNFNKKYMVKNLDKKIPVMIKKTKKIGYLLACQNNFFGELHYFILYKKDVIPMTINEFNLIKTEERKK